MLRKFYNSLKQKDESKWILLLGIIIIIASLRIYWLNILVEDDYYYGIYRWQELGSGPSISSETFWITNRWLCWIAGNVDPYLARSLVLLWVVVPCAALIFIILRKTGYPLAVAFFSATMVWVFPGQTEIPLFVNGSYTADALLVMLVAFWCGLKFIENESGPSWGLYSAAIVAHFLALNLSELVVPGTGAILFCYIFWGRCRKKAWLLTVPVILLSMQHVYFNILHGGRGMIHQSQQLTYRTFGNILLSFVDWCLPATLISQIDDHIWIKFAIFMGVFVLYLGIFAAKTVKSISDGPGGLIHRLCNDEILWRAVFPLLLLFLPLLVMSIAPWFHPRHAIFSAIGFYIMVSFLLVHCLRLNNKRILTVMALLIMASMVKHDSTIAARYSKPNSDSRDFIEFSGTRQFPPGAQIVVVNMDVTACGYSSWSSGYLQYALKRADVSGLIGDEIALVNPFKKPDFSPGGMNGLDISKPLFLYRKKGRNFEPLTHLLQWNGDGLNSDYTIYRVDPVLGRIEPFEKGNGWLSYLKQSSMLAPRGIRRSDILWGGEPTEYDRKRFPGI